LPSEQCDEKDHRRFDYIFNQSASELEQADEHGVLTGVKRDIGNAGMTLDDFLKQPDARKAQLTKAHVLALRLYTSNSFWRVNKPLRDGCTEVSPHPYAATTYYIHDGIMKLRVIREADATAVRTFWRGMDNMGVTEEFLAQGGTEMACMSTTAFRAVARTFAKVGEVDFPLLLKVESKGLMCCGASIAWVSMYPEEQEVLFPPLTYLRPVRDQCEVMEDGCKIITVEPHF
jgi:hypothetical protein